MSALKLPPDLSILAGLATSKPIGDPSLPSSPATLALPAQNQTIALPNSLGSFSVSAGAQAAFAVVNSASDANVDGYFDLEKSTPPAAQDPANAPLLEAPVPYDATQAYLVLTGLSATGKVADKLTVGANGAVGLGGNFALDISACTAFARTTPIWDALQAAAQNFKTVFSSAELQSLSPTETVSLGIQGGLCLTLSLTYTSLAPALAETVASVLGAAGPFSFTAGPSATLSVTGQVTDGYRIYAQRPNPGATRFSITKQASTSLGLDGGLGLSVSVSEPDLDALITAAAAQLAGVLAADLRAALAAGAGSLSLAQTQLVADVAAKLGLSDPTQSALSWLQTELAALATDLVGRITAKVSAQFTYTWQRLTSDALAVQFSVPDAALDAHLPAIVSLDLSAVTALNPPDGIVVTRLLGQTIQQIDVGYGFSFGVFGYVFLKSLDSAQTRFIELDTRTPQNGLLRQFSFLGKRGYTATWFGATQANSVELNAAMPAPLAAPTAGDFTVGLSVAFAWTGVDLGSILETLADHAVLIGASDSDSVPDTLAALSKSGVAAGLTGSATVSLVAPQAALQLLLPALTGPAYRTMYGPYALAWALPCTADVEQFAERAQGNRRGQAYAQMWSSFLATPNPDTSTVPRCCRADLPAIQCPGPLVAAEGEDPNGRVWSAATIAAEASVADLQDAVLNQVPRALSLLQTRQGDFHTLFAACSDGLAELAAQPFGCRVLAALLRLAATQVPGGLGLLSRSVHITWSDSGRTRSVVLKGGS
jgi:hypothetical protein